MTDRDKLPSHDTTGGSQATRSHGGGVGGCPPARAKRLGDFELIRELSDGGRGIVYEAWQVSLNRKVALKVLPESLTADETARARLMREARAAAGEQLLHPGRRLRVRQRCR